MTEAKAEALAQSAARKAAALQERDARIAASIAAKQVAAAEKKLRTESARLAQFEDEQRWTHEAVSRRNYASYDAYIEHQTQKLDAVKAKLLNRFDETTEAFSRRFKLLDLKPPKSVLCLGARLGQEVKAFISLDHFAVGLDLNPGTDNPFVVKGDFHQLQFADGSIDCVYINSVDHILDVTRIGAEISRVLKSDGLFVADIVAGYEEGFVAGEYEALHWPRARQFAESLASVADLRLMDCRDLTDVGSPLWSQCTFRR